MSQLKYFLSKVNQQRAYMTNCDELICQNYLIFALCCTHFADFSLNHSNRCNPTNQNSGLPLTNSDVYHLA